MAKNNDGKRTNFEIETQIEYLSQESIEEILTTRWEKKQIVCYVYCLHDKDTYTKKDEEEGKGKYGDPKKPHWHIYIKLKESRTFADVAKWFGIGVTFVQKIKAGTFEGGCIYATHANAPDKYQYPVTDAISSPGFDYAKIVEIKQQAFKREKKMDAAYQRKMEICSMIEDGVINPFNKHQMISMEDLKEHAGHIKVETTLKYYIKAGETSKEQGMRILNTMTTEDPLITIEGPGIGGQETRTYTVRKSQWDRIQNEQKRKK